MRVAIIGAGPAGLSALRAFKFAQKKGPDIPEILCFEKQAGIGGNWNFTEQTGTDNQGEPIHSSMYRGLWSNNPKEVIEYADYSFEEHFGCTVGSFLPRAAMQDYIYSRARKYELEEQVTTRTVVRHTSFISSTQKFHMTVQNLETSKIYQEQVDYVVVANGHFCEPFIPNIPGLSEFQGKWIHSHDFRDARLFEGKKILCTGSSFSGQDIASQCYKQGAKSVSISYHQKPTQYSWPKEIEQRPQVSNVQEDIVHFSDGSKYHYDAIILCTGYQYYFPFLEDDIRLKAGRWDHWLPPLYKSLFFIPNPRIMYLGMINNNSLSFFDIQALLARDYIMGHKILPESEMMMEENMRKYSEMKEMSKDRVGAFKFR